jgi:hypothetical protein
MSKLSIKNKTLLIANKKVKKVSTLTIKSEHSLNGTFQTTKLSDVLDFLPQGIIYKEETGMGATTLELIAARNSIIVEPIKVTASTKAFKHSKGINKVLYVGGPTKLHPLKSPSDQDILNYLNNKSIKYKKIIVVAYSLHRVLKAVGKNNYKKYFLLIDEIDSIQLDSTFRTKMEECLDFYLEFPKGKRAMLSATSIKFTHPALISENRVNIKYEHKIPRKITLYTTKENEINGSAVDILKNLITKYPNDKFFVAFNSVSECLNLATHLADNNIVHQDEIKILCSEKKKNTVKQFYSELESTLLPGKINFATSAYYTGFDIDEKYHLLTISTCINDAYILSENKMKQIAGRCRPGLLSETILHDSFNQKKSVEIQTIQQMEDFANKMIDALKCMSQHLSSNIIYERNFNKINSIFTDGLNDFNIQYVRKLSDNKFAISYFNIDSNIEQQRVYTELYANNDDLYNELIKNGESVNHINLSTNTNVANVKMSPQALNLEIETVCNALLTLNTIEEVQAELENENYSKIQLNIIKDYSFLVEYLDPQSTLKIIKDSLIIANGSKINYVDTRKYNRVINSALLCTLHHEHIVHRTFNAYFLNAKRIDLKNVVDRVSKAIAESNLISHHIFSKFKMPKKQEDAVKFLNLFYLMKRNPNKNSYDIIGKNPHGFVINNTTRSPISHSSFIQKHS